MTLPKAFIDVTSLQEDNRIKIIGDAVMRTGATVGITIDDEPGKPERYIQKITERYPMIEVIDQRRGIPGCVVVRVRRKPDA